MRITIFSKILLGFAVLLMLVIVSGIYTAHKLNQTSDRYALLVTRNTQLIDDVRAMQVAFKKQVQEWKDILLRGHEPQALEQYTRAFLSEYGRVQALGAKLRKIDLAPQNRTLLEQFLSAHQTLQQQYSAALDLFKAGTGGHSKEADTAVKGFDRTPTDLLDTLVENMLAETKQNNVVINKQAKTAGKLTLAVLLGTLALAIGVSLITARKLSTPIMAITGVLREIAQGNLSVQTAITSKDEIGDLARSTQTMIAYLREIEAIAEKISHKDLQVNVAPKSDQDVLNHSLHRMVTNLRAMIAENDRTMIEIQQQSQQMQQQNWLKDGISQLSATLAGDHSLKEVCEQAINFVARCVNAGCGVLYTYHPEQKLLTLHSSFAFTERDHLSNTYALGEGIIGQVALERAPILLKNMTREDSLITTGIVSDAPVNTYTFPLLYENELYGVLELASFEPIDAIKQAFLTEANRVIATSLFSTAQRERVQELFRQSQEAAKEAEYAKGEAQQQTEEAQRINTLLEEKQQELRQQSEELQQMNAQLEEREQQLRQQQEELRQQNERLKQTQAV